MLHAEGHVSRLIWILWWLSFGFVAGNKPFAMFLVAEMGPSVVDTVVDLRNIQRSLWEVSPAGSACSTAHGGLVTFY